MSSSVIILILALMTISELTYGYNILAIVSLPLKSHYMAFQRLFRELANRGHSVTVMNNFPDENPVRNLKFVDLQQYNASNVAAYFTPLYFYETFDSKYRHLYNFYRHFEVNPESTKADCENFFQNDNVKAFAKEERNYDVIFVEQFIGECGLAYAGAMFDAPIIGITSHVLLPSAYPRLGLRFDVSSDAFYFSDAGTHPNLYKRVEAFLMHIFYNTLGKMYLQKNVYEVFNKYLPHVPLDIEKVVKERMKMLFSYQHFSLTGSRPLAPQLIEIGGIHIDTPKLVPEDIEMFLSKAEYGAIFVSFGSNLKANTMSKDKLEQFLRAFQKVPQRVVWKYENATFRHEDIYTGNWLPQLDILCHPKIVGFVSHGGMLSLSEAAHCGKPLVTVPFFGDQYTNAAVARQAGIGITLHFDHLNADNLAESIRKLTEPKMQQNAKRVCKLWHDRQLPVMDHAIYWTEYVARHGDSPASLPSQRTPWYQRFLLDVVATIFVVILLIFAIFYVILYVLAKIIASTLSILISKSKPNKNKLKKT